MPTPLDYLTSTTTHARLAETIPAGPGEPTAIIDAELARLFAARELFMTWVDSGAADITPAAFLRAWGDSTARVLALLRARRELSADGTLDALLQAVYEHLEQTPNEP
jgi:hypothetical protein